MKVLKRALRFMSVGTICTLLQIGLLHLFGYVLLAALANALAFIVSAQLNFALSYRVTWHDADRKTGLALGLAWLQYNALIVVTAGVNTVAFVMFRDILSGPDAVAVLFAGVISTTVTFIVNHRLIFRTRGIVMESPQGVALFMPALDEAENLPFVVGEAVSYLYDRGEPFHVIVVDDGSTDNTYEVVGSLQMTYPNHVKSVQHNTNRGYGQALRTGFDAALMTGHEWVAFCDGDGQFKPHEVGKLLDRAIATGADLAIGYRINRADSLKRRLMGHAWHLLSRFAYRYEATDTDCGFKLFRREALLILVPELTGVHAEISPEIIGRASRHNFKIVEVGVNHYPRKHGNQTGAAPNVMRRSVEGLVRLSLSLSNGRRGSS
jgi:putative flippase GtrA